jgi:hypothetical protein
MSHEARQATPEEIAQAQAVQAVIDAGPPRPLTVTEGSWLILIPFLIVALVVSVQDWLE